MCSSVGTTTVSACAPAEIGGSELQAPFFLGRFLRARYGDGVKVARIYLENFKRFQTHEIQVRNALTQDVAERFLVLGDNGTGKTTVLQAVALCLSMACGRTYSVSDFNWLGWLAGRYERWGRPFVELEVHFDEAEIAATREAARRWFDARSPQATVEGRTFVEPGESRVVTLRLEGGHCYAPSREEFFQFRGRGYAAGLLRTDSGARRLFDRLPGVFWFDQFRNLATPPPPEDQNSGTQGGTGGRVSFDVGVARLRQHLNRWQLNRLNPYTPRPDYLDELEQMYQRIFPNRSFGNPEPMFLPGVPSPEDFYFIINDGARSYDIEEMSAGEQAVFPILYEFVRQRIRHSVVLIDEVDLNLHPPLAQAFLAALPLLGPNCQFLLTTHSEAVTGVFSREQIHRLPGGRLCL